MRAIILVSVAGALALAACGRRDDASEAPPAPAAAPSEPAAPPPAATARRKPGLWEQSVSIAGIDYAQTTRLCLDPATDEKLSWWGGQTANAQCSKSLALRQTDGAWRFSTVCDMGSGGKVTTSGVATGDFNSHYEVQAESSTQGAALEQMNGARKMTIVADWRGACPDGMKGGEVLLPGGLRMNLLDPAAAG